MNTLVATEIMNDTITIGKVRFYTSADKEHNDK